MTRRPSTTVVALVLAAASAVGLGASGSPAGATATTDLATPAAATTFTGTVTARTGLAQRTAPSTHVRRSGAAFSRGSVLLLDCQLNGTSVDGNQRWYKIHGRDAWVAARYVRNVGAAPYACTGGDWAYRVTVGTNIRQGPSTKDRKIGSYARGTDINTRWIVARGQSVDGNPNWVSVETPTGNRGWISVTNLRKVG